MQPLTRGFEKNNPFDFSQLSITLDNDLYFTFHFR